MLGAGPSALPLWPADLRKRITMSELMSVRELLGNRLGVLISGAGSFLSHASQRVREEPLVAATICIWVSLLLGICSIEAPRRPDDDRR